MSNKYIFLISSRQFVFDAIYELYRYFSYTGKRINTFGTTLHQIVQLFVLGISEL